MDAPALTDINGWWNGDPVHIADREQPVLLQFWTATSLNCLHDLPPMRQLWAAYRGTDLTVVGVHSPDFSFEADPDFVARAVDRHDIHYPVANDAENTTWKAYGDRYWPRKALIDGDGTIQYEVTGEGGYRGLEQHIRRLLHRTGADLPDPVYGEEADPSARSTPVQLFDTEMYAGAGRSGTLGNTHPYSPHARIDYVDDGQHELHTMYLNGEWRQEDEYVEFVGDPEGDAYVTFRFSGSTCYAVLGAAGESAAATVHVDGDPVPAQHRGQAVDQASRVVARTAGMYRLVHGDVQHIREMTLYPKESGFRLYKLTCE